MARVVVTGAAGFLGSHLCDRLLERGDEVVGLDNLVTGKVANIEHSFGRPGFTFAEHDVSTYLWVPGEVDAVMHLASPASPKDYLEMPIQTLKVGSLGTHNGLGLARAKGAKFFLASTSEVYGDPQVHPQAEEYWGHVNPVGPRGVYDEAKRFAEAMTMAYHRHHGLEVRIVRIFNSILGDEQVLFDDGEQLRRMRADELASRLGASVDLDGYCVPAFAGGGAMCAAEASAFVGHPTTAPCFEVRSQYGRSVRVTGDHSLFVRGDDGQPVARPVSELAIGDRIAVARRIEVPERDRRLVRLSSVWESNGRDPWDLMVRDPGLGAVGWRRRREIFDHLAANRRPDSPVWRSILWGELARHRDREQLPLGALRLLGLDVPPDATVRVRTGGRSHELPEVVHLDDELLWALGLWVAEGTWAEDRPKTACLIWSCEANLLDRVEKVLDRQLHLPCTRVAGSTKRAASLRVNSTLLLELMGSLGFGEGPRSIPGWILGLPLHRLGHFLEGYREGDGVHSGAKLDEAQRHEFSTVSEALKDDLVVALARFGICPSVGCYETTNRPSSGEKRFPFWRITVPKVSPWSPLDWHRGVDQTLQSPVTGDLVWAMVRSIEPVESTPLVYDFCVPGYENFWAGSGVMAHNTYGPRMRPQDGRVVSNFVMQALRGEPITIYGDGNQTRSFCYVDDEVRGFLALLDSDQTGPINIGNPGEFTIRELADIVIELTGSSSEIVHEPLPVDDPMQRQPDITKARELLGWEPTVQLREGLRRTIEHFAALV
ncbi:MAG TPA: GDP-mannose 4,6-dehydratase [Acidimicrobiales bacterium]|nr:GDP-mannose 4,6-dehydratase [Acidimicrobiales bacterium]